MPVLSATCYELLGVPVEAQSDALESAWKLRRLEAQERLGSLAAEEVEALCARVDEAFRILADPIRAARYRRYCEHVEAPKRPPPADVDAQDPLSADVDASAPSSSDVDASDLPEWGGDPDAVLTDPGLRTWPHELAAVTDDVELSSSADDLDLLADVVRAAALRPPLPEARDLPPWRTPDAPVLRATRRSAAPSADLAPAAFGPGEKRAARSPAPWSED